MSTIISVKNLGKRYKLRHERGGYVALRDKLAHPIKALKARASQEEFWALRGVDFAVEKGEVLGIIGANGAGKSTLLKILSRITPPSEGEVRMSGTVSSLLEVGTGFHPELTGRENIYLNGAILGMTKAEIQKKFDEIVEFSGVEAFLDTPVKRYSSGMQVRLAFAVAAHLEPDILVIDEVLAVGDAAFQKKSLGKMEEVTKKDGRTILFVSHNMDAVARLCTRCVLLEKGTVVAVGKPDEIIAQYLNNHQATGAEKTFTATSTTDIALKAIRVKDKQGKLNNRLESGAPFTIEVEYQLEKDLSNVYVGASFIDLMTNHVVLNTLDIDANKERYINREKGIYRSTFTFEKNPFNAGRYKLFVHLGTFPATPRTLVKSDGDVSIAFIEGETFVTDTLDGKRDGHILLTVPSRIEKINK